MRNPHQAEPARLFVEPLEDRRMLATIQVIAAGTTNTEILELEIDGNVAAVFDNLGTGAFSGQFLNLEFNDPEIQSIETLRLNFTNDGLENGVSRDVRIDAIVVDGERFETEAPTTFSVGSYVQDEGCGPGFKESEFLHCNGFVEFQLGSIVSPIVGELGEAAVTHETSFFQFETPIVDPVIVTSVPTFNGRSSGMMAINNVTDTGFDLRFREWDYLNDRHVLEQVEWLAVASGNYTTADGSQWEAGKFTDSNNQLLKRHSFDVAFENPPIVLAAVQTTNGSPVIVRINNVSATSFGYSLYEEESELGTNHVEEVIGYVAFSQDSRSGVVTIGEQVLPYQYDEFSIDHRATAVNNRVSILVHEERSADNEIQHVEELTDVVTFGSVVFAQDYALQGGDPFTYRSIRTETDVTLPTGFEFTEVIGGEAFQDAVAIEIADDGQMFVAEESGVIWKVIDGAKLPTPFLDLSPAVTDDFADQGGFSAVVLDPNFSSNGHLYVMYTTEVNGEELGRVERYTRSSTNPDVADPESQLILIGNTATDGLIKGSFHNTGDLEFGTDGSLLISWGDTATNAEDDPNQFRSQDLNAAAGKIFRINPLTGQGYASNPFFTGDPNSIASKVWAYGARNGFRFDVVPGTGSQNVADGNPGTLFIADVGRNDFDELNVANGGENFGWPYFEGPQAFREGGQNLDVTFPAVSFAHPDARSIIGGAFYSGTTWPAEYQNRYFVADFVNGWMRSFALNSDGTISEFGFATEIKGMTDMAFDPISGQMFLVGRGRDIIFAEGEGLDGLYSISFTG